MPVSCEVIFEFSFTYVRSSCKQTISGGVKVNEKYAEIIQQYGIESTYIRKGRSGWICEDGKNVYLLKEYQGTVKRLEFEDQVLSQIKKADILRVDGYVPTIQGELAAQGNDGCRYVLKEWFLDRECSLKDTREIMGAVRAIANLHRLFREIPAEEDWSLGSIAVESIDQELKRHNRELKRARNYIRGKRKKTEFELCVIGNFQMFYEQAEHALEGLKKMEEEWGSSHRYLCHGDLNHHHVLVGSGSIAIIEYNKMHLGNQMTDLYHFVRKVLEKQNWDQKLGMEMLETYHQILPLGKQEREYLYYLFLYPEKYWKQINFYFNANKAWIPARNVEKLESLEAQMEVRSEFLKMI